MPRGDGGLQEFIPTRGSATDPKTHLHLLVDITHSEILTRALGTGIPKQKIMVEVLGEF